MLYVHHPETTGCCFSSTGATGFSGGSVVQLAGAASYGCAPATVRVGREINLVDLAFADVPNYQVTGLTIEGEAPGVSQAVRPDLELRAGHADEGISGWDPIRSA